MSDMQHGGLRGPPRGALHRARGPPLMKDHRHWKNRNSSIAFKPYGDLIDGDALRAITIPASVLITIANAAVIYIILRKKSLRKLRNMPLLSLAAADLIIGLILGPLFVATSLSGRKSSLCVVYLVAETFCYTASLLNMLVVSIERWIAIFQPLRYNRLVRPLLVWGMVVCAWSLSLILAISKSCFRCGIMRRRCGYKWKKQGAFPVVFSAMFIILSFIMGVMQVRIYRVVRSHMRRIAPISAKENFDTDGDATIGNSSKTVMRSHFERRRSAYEGTSNEVGSLEITMMQTRKNTQGAAFIARIIVTEQSPARSVELREGSARTNQNNEDRNAIVPSIVVNNNKKVDNDASNLFLSDAVTLSRDTRSLSLPATRPYVTVSQGRRRRLTVDIARQKLQHGTAHAVSLLYLIFILMWCPYIILVLLRYAGRAKQAYIDGATIAKLLIFFNSLVNPLIYTIRIYEFRKALKETICCKKRNT